MQLDTRELRFDDLAEIHRITINEFKDTTLDDFIHLLSGYMVHGPSRILLSEDSLPIVCGGLLSSRPGVGGVWFVPTEQIYQHKKEVYKWCKQWIQYCIDTYELYRLETVVEDGKDKYVTFAERFGFELEGKLRCWSDDGKDYLIYSIINKNNLRK